MHGEKGGNGRRFFRVMLLWVYWVSWPVVGCVRGILSQVYRSWVGLYAVLPVVKIVWVSNVFFPYDEAERLDRVAAYW